MAKEDLIPFDQRTEEEQKKIRSKGGKASGEARRRKKLLKELLQIELENTTEEGELKEVSITKALIEQAQKGNVKAYGMIRDTLGQAPVQKIQTSEVDPEVVKEVEELIEQTGDTMAEGQSE